ncbi:hypothetical protein MesoLjLc_21250 [Mesorhizobium sp. L-8-10]|uniref:hypothetical protein n=1 Tax=unclassified Mesorhizobium TaxID=325217 RepID=UPI001928AF36|nr:MULTISPECIES: hypothetical protein [unclassified Mesorhizobium]BCH22382.1 hypothetical protein MesoLjLb_21670 [Mesorhizobium sp. L-8-3]BCH30195.1 hypothetical protein MesoLjLc_21250 [Mesorhizobium sp. L-8-10]
MTDRFPSGSIIRYPYLWRWQRNQGRENAEKDRPVCLAIALRDPARSITHLVILPISGTSPLLGQLALEIPALELRRAGLSMFKRGWVTVDEFNYDIAERSYYFEPNQKPRGMFGPSFMEEIRRAIRPILAAGRGRVDRTL